MSPCITNFLSTLSFSSLRTLFCNLRALFYSHPFLTRALLLFILVKTFEQNAAISLFGFCCSSLFSTVSVCFFAVTSCFSSENIGLFLGAMLRSWVTFLGRSICFSDFAVVDGDGREYFSLAGACYP